MRITLPLLVCLCALSASVLGAQEAKPAKATHPTQSHPVGSTHHARHSASKPTKQTEAYAHQGPLAPPPTPEVTSLAAATGPAADAPAVVEPVVVTYQRGALAIATLDTPLREVLDKVREATGAMVEAPDFEQRVSVTVAAKAPLQAIAALLDGMHLDYACV